METNDFKHLPATSDNNESTSQPIIETPDQEPTTNGEPQPDSQDQSEYNSKTKKDTETTKKKPKVILNNADCRYEVVRYVSKKLLGYKLTNDPEIEWDVLWTDNAVQPETLARMQPYQKINHFPGMYSLARKNHLGRNLMRMKKSFPENYDFFPQTYLLPAEYSEFRAQFNGKKNGKTFIVKPEASCQGKGIFLTKTFENVQPGEHYVVQRYLQKPFLLDGLKFDLRIYVLLAGTDPLRIYLYDDGLGRFATEEYITPTAANIDNMCMHLTNYAINKDNPNFVFNKSAEDDDVGHKRSLKAVMKMLEEKGHDVKALWNNIKKILIKLFCSVQPILAHNYKSCQPDEPYNNMCFELLGIDIMLDHKLRPWLLEVNHTPSFTTDTPLDKAIKRNVIRDTLNLMNVSSSHRIKYKNKRKNELQQRVLTGKKAKATPEEKQAAHEKAQQERDKWEANHLGGFEKVYPFDDPSKAEENYDEFIKVAHKWWEEWTGTAAKKNVKKESTSDVKKPPPMNFSQSNPSSNQGVRAKEIQNVYTQQKSKSGSLIQKVKTPVGGSKSTKGNPSDEVPDQNENDTVNPWNPETVNLGPLAPERVIGEDDLDYYGSVVPIREQNSVDSDAAEEENNEEQATVDTTGKKSSNSTLPHIGMPSMRNQEKSPSMDVSQKLTLTSRGSVTTENPLETCQPFDQTRTSAFKIKRIGSMQASDLSSRTSILNKVEKENSKAPFFQKTSSMNVGEHTSIFGSTSNANMFSRSLNKISEDFQMKPEKAAPLIRAPLKPNTGVLGDSIFDDLNGARSTADLDKNVRTLNKIDAGGKPFYLRNELPMKVPQKKNTAMPILQQRNPSGSFLKPQIFELSFQGCKAEQPKRITTVGSMYPAMKNMGKALIKGSLLQKELSSQSGYIGGQNQETQQGLNKYQNFGYEAKK